MEFAQSWNIFHQLYNYSKSRADSKYIYFVGSLKVLQKI